MPTFTHSRPKQSGISAFLKTIVNHILYPLISQLPALAAMTMLLWFAQSINIIIRFQDIVNIPGRITFIVIKGLCAFCVPYLILLVAGLLKGKFRKSLILAGWIFVSLCSLVDIICMGFLGTEYFSDYIAIVMGTNVVETTEYLQQYLSWSLLWYFLLALLPTLLVYWLSTKIHLSLGHAGVILSAVLFLLLVEIHFKKPLFTFSETNFINATATIHKINSLKHWVQQDKALNPLPFEISGNATQRPEKIVLIIGESLSSEHCSLYGYAKKTQPRLEKFQKDSNLIVWKHACSPATSTVKSFKQMFTTWDGTDQTLPYYQAPNIISVVNKAGWKSIWISNQTKTGLAENVITEFAAQSSISTWRTELNLGGGGMQNVNLHDGFLLPIITDNYNNEGSENSFTVIHLQGSHAGYANRSPENCREWSSEDYPKLPDNQKATIAAYDNSVLFNDSIVSYIMNLYSKDNALIIYLSDHGQDLYQSAPDYCGHGRVSDIKSQEAGIKIPMMVYMTDEARKELPMLEHKIRDLAEAQDTWNSTNLIYLICDILGLEIISPTQSSN